MVFGGLVLAIVIGVFIVGLTYTQAAGLVNPPRSTLAQTPADWGITNWENVEFISADGLRLQGWFFPPSTKDASLILVHGLAASRLTMLEQAVLVNQQGLWRTRV